MREWIQCFQKVLTRNKEYPYFFVNQSHRYHILI